MVTVDRVILARAVTVLAALERSAKMPEFHSRDLQLWLTLNLNEEIVSTVDFNGFYSRWTHGPSS